MISKNLVLNLKEIISLYEDEIINFLGYPRNKEFFSGLNLKFKDSEIHNSIYWSKRRNKFRFFRRKGITDSLVASFIGFDRDTIREWRKHPKELSPSTLMKIDKSISKFLGNLKCFYDKFKEIGEFPTDILTRLVNEHLLSYFSQGDKPHSYESIGMAIGMTKKTSRRESRKYIKKYLCNLLEHNPGIFINTFGLNSKSFKSFVRKYEDKIVSIANNLYKMAFGILGTSYKGIVSALNKNGEFKISINQVEWIEKVFNRGEVSPSKLRVKVKCLKHGHISTKRINTITCSKDSDHYSGCISCNNYKNEKLTGEMLKKIFGNIFESQKNLLDIIPEVDLKHRIDNYQEIRKKISINLLQIDFFGLIKANGRILKLGVESDGQQHEDSKDGFEAYLGISRFIGKEGGSKWKGRCQKWRALLERDKFEDIVFKKFADEDFYLIRIPTYKIDESNRSGYFINELETLTGLCIDEVI